MGRVFVLRLEDREPVQASIEIFARKKKISCAKLQLIGGVDKGSEIIVGPKAGRALAIEPVSVILEEMHEAVGNGTIFPDRNGSPQVHCHLSCGRGEKTICGEIRRGVYVWHVMEVIITELIECQTFRRLDETTGFELLYPVSEFRAATK
jgi:predicted DNA-binding protein with PD1-like motif